MWHHIAINTPILFSKLIQNLVVSNVSNQTGGGLHVSTSPYLHREVMGNGQRIARVDNWAFYAFQKQERGHA